MTTPPDIAALRKLAEAASREMRRSANAIREIQAERPDADYFKGVAENNEQIANVLDALLDALDAARRERDEARAIVDRGTDVANRAAVTIKQLRAELAKAQDFSRFLEALPEPELRALLAAAGDDDAFARPFMAKLDALKGSLAAARAEAAQAAKKTAELSAQVEALRADLAHFAPYFESGVRALCPDPTAERRRLDAARARWEKKAE